MVFFRWFLGLPMAAVITAALFAIMAGLIRKPNIALPPVRENPEINLGMKPEPDRLIQENPISKELPKQPPTDIEFPGPTEKPTGGGAPGPGKLIIENQDGPIVGPVGGAIITYPPPYPEACRTRGIEGVVLVQFDVTPEGNVVNARVIDAPDRCFNRIVSTVVKWKYPPAYENGRPVMRYGVIEQFRFELTE